MNKKMILFGSILTVVILMVLPSIPTLEVNTVVESNKSHLLDEIQNIDVKDF